MTAETTQPDPGAKDAAPNFPATAELVSGHDTPFVKSEDLDVRAFDEAERIGQPWSRERGFGGIRPV